MSRLQLDVTGGQELTVAFLSDEFALADDLLAAGNHMGDETADCLAFPGIKVGFLILGLDGDGAGTIGIQNHHVAVESNSNVPSWDTGHTPWQGWYW